MLLRMLSYLLNTGVKGNTGSDQSVRIINAMALLGIVITLTYIPLFIWRQIIEGGQYYIIILTIILILFLFSFVYILNHAGKRRLAASFLILLAIAETFGFCILFYGGNMGIQNFMIAFPALYLLLFNRKEDLKLFILYSLLCVPCFLYVDILLKDPVFPFIGPDFPYTLFRIISSVSAILLVGASVFFFSYDLNDAKDKLAHEHNRANDLLLNILPETIAERLKSDNKNIADGFASTTILFADIVGFTELAEKYSAAEVVQFLNTYFSEFDRLTEKYQLEKIKTIGDAYMVAAGIPVPCEDHAQKMANFALDIITATDSISREKNINLNIRVGINTGPVTAGVIGTKKFIYDLWGDAVNIAARMEAHGIPGKIQVTEKTYEILKNDFTLEYRGMVDIKGKGQMKSYILIS